MIPLLSLLGKCLCAGGGGDGFGVAGVGGGALVAEDESGDQGSHDSECGGDKVAVMEAMDGGRGQLLVGRRTQQVEVVQVTRAGRGGDAGQDGQADCPADLLRSVKDAGSQAGLVMRYAGGGRDSHTDESRSHAQAEQDQAGGHIAPESTMNRYVRQPE